MSARLFAFKIREGQETNMALFIDDLINSQKSSQQSEDSSELSNADIKAIVYVPKMNGVLLAETSNPRYLEALLRGQKHYKGRIYGTVKLEEIEPLIKPRTVMEVLNLGDEIEVVSGALRGSRGKVLRIDKSRNEVTFQPAEVAIPMPMTISIDMVKIVKQAEKGATQP
ncbi:transcription elongation factor Spt5 [Candidatus Marsarchaeota G2 archaeon BE_D]|uniref:Transcription elongation factor Spt5 n=1 Tax=Candidatus Marsarchaeota G2 archaeon BE_D TaxID=1978158 RepID=A0A2R6CBY9_9ARCH|nr:MAG: transcription elongation factor Spt5 [Candidatus Marsarchaeota G2 archaeon BE_D]